MKGFNLATVGGAGSIGSQTGLASSTPSLAGSTYLPTSAAACSRTSMQTLDETSPVHSSTGGGAISKATGGSPAVRSPITKLAQLARLAGKQKVLDSKKNRWGNLIEAAKSARGVSRMWTRSRSRSEDSVSSSEGSNQQQPGAPPAEGDLMRSSSRRDKTHVRARTSYPLGVVHVTENELPEVLEESGIDYELSGRMGMDSINNTHSPNVNLRRFRRACSEPADQVTLILESKLSLPLEATQETSEGSSRSLAAPVPGGLASNPSADSAAVAPTCSIPHSSPAGTSPRWGHQKLPDGLLFMDDSASDPTSSSDPPLESSSSLYKSYNGAPTLTAAASGSTPRQTTISGEVHGIQPLGRNFSGGGWL